VIRRPEGSARNRFAAIEFGDDPAGGHWLAGADRKPDRTREHAPVLDDLGVCLAPGVDVVLNLGIGALAVGGDATPCTDAAAEPRKPARRPCRSGVPLRVMSRGGLCSILAAMTR